MRLQVTNVFVFTVFDFIAFSKRPAVPSSYTINLHEVTGRLQRIIDVQFLHGYYEPTLLVLFESLRTWAG